MAVTLREVAARAGVSRSAVSRTFTDGASVSARTRAKVEVAAQALGYSPNVLARSLTTGRTKLIGLVADNFRNPIFLEVFDLFTRALQDRGLRPLLVNLTDQTDPADSLRLLQQYSVDGVVIASSTLPLAFSEAFHAAGVPVVHAFGRARQDAEVPVVTIDNVACGRLAAATLIARGYRRLGFLGGPEAATSSQDRLAGFRAVAEAEGMAPSVDFASAYTFEAGHDRMRALLERQSRDWVLPEAIFCGDDVISIGAMAALREGGFRVPEDVGLIGLNDMEISGWPNIALTTIRQPIPEIVAAVIARMTSLLAAPEQAPTVEVFECHVVERGTLRPLPG